MKKIFVLFLFMVGCSGGLRNFGPNCDDVCETLTRLGCDQSFGSSETTGGIVDEIVCGAVCGGLFGARRGAPLQSCLASAKSCRDVDRCLLNTGLH